MGHLVHPPTIVGDGEFTSITQCKMQSCILCVLQHVINYLESQLRYPRFCPRLAQHDAHGVESAIAIAHGVHNEDPDRLVVRDYVCVFHIPPIVCHTITMVVHLAREARHEMVRSNGRGIISDAEHLKKTGVLIHHHSGKDRVAQSFFSTNIHGPWRKLLNDIHTLRTDPEMQPHLSLER
jgi:hypothetical protein